MKARCTDCGQALILEKDGKGYTCWLCWERRRLEEERSYDEAGEVPAVWGSRKHRGPRRREDTGQEVRRCEVPLSVVPKDRQGDGGPGDAGERAMIECPHGFFQEVEVCHACEAEGELRLANVLLQEAVKQRDEARALAWEYRWDIRSCVGEYQWEKNWASDAEDYPWLPEKWDDFKRTGM